MATLPWVWANRSEFNSALNFISIPTRLGIHTSWRRWLREVSPHLGRRFGVHIHLNLEEVLR